MLALSAESLILIPVVIDANRLEVEDGPGTRLGPAHTGLLRTILDQVATIAENAKAPEINDHELTGHGPGRESKPVADASVL